MTRYLKHTRIKFLVRLGERIQSGGKRGRLFGSSVSASAGEEESRCALWGHCAQREHCPGLTSSWERGRNNVRYKWSQPGLVQEF